MSDFKHGWTIAAGSIGFLAGVLATTWLVTGPVHRAYQHAADATQRLAQERAARQACDARVSETEGAYTLIYDAGLEPSIADRAAAAMAKSVGIEMPVGHDGPRWFIPQRVDPILYGPADGSVFFWVDKNSKQARGPFTPQGVQ